MYGYYTMRTQKRVKSVGRNKGFVIYRDTPPSSPSSIGSARRELFSTGSSRGSSRGSFSSVSSIAPSISPLTPSSVGSSRRSPGSVGSARRRLSFSASPSPVKRLSVKNARRLIVDYMLDMYKDFLKENKNMLEEKENLTPRSYRKSRSFVINNMVKNILNGLLSKKFIHDDFKNALCVTTDAKMKSAVKLMIKLSKSGDNVLNNNSFWKDPNNMWAGNKMKLVSTFTTYMTHLLSLPMKEAMFKGFSPARRRLVVR